MLPKRRNFAKSGHTARKGVLFVKMIENSMTQKSVFPCLARSRKIKLFLFKFCQKYLAQILSESLSRHDHAVGPIAL